MVNAQPSLLGQHPVPMMGGPPTQQYNGAPAQYTSVSEQATMVPPSQAGWGTAPPVAPQSMPMQMHNNVYMPPGTMPLQVAPGMQFPSHSTLQQPTSTLPTYGSDRIQ